MKEKTKRGKGRPPRTYKYFIENDITGKKLAVPIHLFWRWETLIRKRDKFLKELEEHFKK